MKLLKKINFKFIDYDIDQTYNIIKIYKNARVFPNKINNTEKLNFIKNNIVGLEGCKKFPKINMENLEYLDITTSEITI